MGDALYEMASVLHMSLKDQVALMRAATLACRGEFTPRFLEVCGMVLEAHSAGEPLQGRALAVVLRECDRVLGERANQEVAGG